MDEYINWWGKITNSEAKAIVLHLSKTVRDFDDPSITNKIKIAYDKFHKSIK